MHKRDFIFYTKYGKYFIFYYKRCCFTAMQTTKELVITCKKKNIYLVMDAQFYLNYKKKHNIVYINGKFVHCNRYVEKKYYNYRGYKDIK